jgi:hypothetical protein
MRRKIMPIKKGKRVTVKVRLLPIFLAVVFLAAFLAPFFLPPTAWAEEGEANGGESSRPGSQPGIQAPYLAAGIQADPNVKKVLLSGETYELNVNGIFSDDDSPHSTLTYYVREGSGGWQQIADKYSYTYQYPGTAKEEVVTLDFKAGDGLHESPVYQVTIKYYEDPSLVPSLEWLRYKVGPAGITIVACEQSAPGVDIPDYIEGKPVTAIAARAFGSCGKLAEIRLPGTLKTIGNSGFSNCLALTRLDLPEGLTAVGENAFNNCPSLQEINIPAGLQKFNPNVFTQCPNLHFSVVAGNPYYAGQEGAVYSKDMTTLIVAGAIAGGSFTAPDSVTAIGAGAFNTNALQSVTLGPNVKTIGENAFNRCTALKEAILSEGLESIGDSAFEGTSALQAIKLPESLASLGWTVFKDSGLAKIDLSPTWLETLPYGTFRGCAQLRDINLGDRITSIEDRAFADCPFPEITLPARLRCLKSGCFENCTGLETITIPYTVRFLGTGVFGNCTALKAVYFEGNMPLRGNGPGVRVPNDYTPENDSFFGLPLAVAENLKIYALQGARGWGDSFADYADGYFMGPTIAKEFIYKVEYYTLDEQAEKDNPRLILHAPESFAGLEPGSVAEPVNLIKAGLPADAGPVVWSSSDDSMAAVDNSGRVTALQAGVCAITASLAYNGAVYTGETEVSVTDLKALFDWSVQRDGTAIINGFREGISADQMFELKIPETIAGYKVTAIRDGAFRNNFYISTVTVPKNVKEIGGGAFANCASMREINLAEGLEVIGDSAFGATDIREIVVPQSVTRIEGGAFYGCTDLKSATVKSDKLEYALGSSLFRDCRSLKEVTLAEGVTKTSGYTFAGCTSLESIKLPSTLQALDMYDFSGCTSLKTVELQGYLLGQDPLISEKYNPFASQYIDFIRGIDNKHIHYDYADCSEDLVILHPDDGSDWGSLFNGQVRTGVRTAAGGIRLDGLSALPAIAGPVAAFNAGTTVAVPWDMVPDTASGGSEEPAGEEKTQSPDGKEAATVFEIVKKAVAENPLLIVSIGVIVLAVLFLGGARRYKQYRKNQ